MKLGLSRICLYGFVPKEDVFFKCKFLKCDFCKFKIEGLHYLVTPVESSILKISSSNFHTVPIVLCSVQ